MSLTILSGLVSLFGCGCMFLVCAAQMQALLAARQPVPANPWEQDFHAPAPQPARMRPAPAFGFIPGAARA